MTSPQREDALRLTGSAGSSTLMEAELLRLVKRSPFEIRVPKPRRDGDGTLLYPFGAELAWVACVHHRTSSRVAWELWSSPADRNEALHEDLLPLVAADDRLDLGQPLGISVEVRNAEDFRAGPLQLRGVVKNAVIEGLAQRGIEARLEPDAPDVVLSVRRGGPPEARLTRVAMDLGGGPRHRRGERAAMVEAPLRETLAAQLVMASRWDARTEPLVDPMAGGATIAIEAAHLAVGHAVRTPAELKLSRLAPFRDLPQETPDLFPGTVPHILACDSSPAAIPAMIGNLRAAGLTGPERERWVGVRTLDVRELAPDVIERDLPGADMRRGVIAVNPPYGQRLEMAGGEEELLELYRDMGRAFGRFEGWRAAVFVAHPQFLEAFGRRPSMTKPMSNGSLRGAFFVFDL